MSAALEMICLQCSAQVVTEGRFCGSCGAAFEGCCRVCGQIHPVGARFCSDCGAGLQASTAAAPRSARAERRQLTVMFCDLVDSTSMTRELDPEDWRAVVKAYQEACGVSVSRYDGFIAQYLGDGLLVYFGYPHAHEDDAERAVRAALEILDRIAGPGGPGASGLSARKPAAVRIGIHTGPVIVDDLGAEGRVEMLALGETPNVAARVQSVAEPNTVWISRPTQRMLAGRFVVEEKRGCVLKGVPDPVVLYHVLRPSDARGRLDPDRAPGLTPLVGRIDELRTLAALWEQARNGAGQVALIRGEAGIGKSRLVQMLAQQIDGQRHVWLDYAGSPYQRTTPFHPVVELLQQLLGWHGEESVDDRLRDLERGLVLAGASASESLPLIAPLLSLPVPAHYPPPFLSPEARRRRILATLADWLCQAARLQPLVMVLEDLQWVDTSTLELQELLVQRCADVPLLLVYTARPGLDPGWLRVDGCVRLNLGRLSRAEVRTMVAEVAARRVLSADMVESVVARTDGVPLFVEELTKTMLESRGSTAARVIPMTLEDSLRARLDRLGPAKEVAQLAAVIGRVFSYELIQAVVAATRKAEGRSSVAEKGFVLTTGNPATLDAALARLVQAELLYVDGQPPAARYVFKHALVQDAAYASLLRSHRRTLHRSIAAVLCETFPTTGQAQPELLAHHYTEAGDVEPAVAAWHRAGEKAAARSAHGAAIRHFRQACMLLATLPESEDRSRREIVLQLALGSSLVEVAGFGHPEIEQVMERVRVLCEAVGDRWQLCMAVGGVANCCINRGELERGTALAEQSLEIARQAGAGVLLVNGHLLLGTAEYYRGNFARAFENRQRAMALFQSSHEPARFPQRRFETGRVDVGVSFGLVAWNYWMLGYPDRALQSAREAVELARNLSHPFSLVFALFCETVVHSLRRTPASQRGLAEQLIELSEAQGFSLFLGLGKAYRAAAGPADGAGAPKEIYDGLMTAMDTTTLGGAPQMIGLLAEAQHMAGRHSHALEKLEMGLALAGQTGQHFWDAELLRLQGASLLGAQATASDAQTAGATSVLPPDVQAEACFHRALEVARRQEGRSWELRTATSLAALWKSQQQHRRARELLAPVCQWFVEGEETGDVRDARTLLAELTS